MIPVTIDLSQKFWRNFLKPWQFSFPDPNRRSSDFCSSVELTDWWIDIHSIGHLFDWPFFNSITQFWWNISFDELIFDELTFLFSWFHRTISIVWSAWNHFVIFFWDTSRICTNSLQSELDYVLDYFHAFLSTHLLHCCRGYLSLPLLSSRL